MISIPKILTVVSCGVVLCASVGGVGQAAERMKPDPCADRKGGQPDLVKCDEETLKGIDTIKGELLRVDRETYVIKRNDGTQAELHVDGTTQMYGNIREGDSIEAKTRTTRDDQKQALSIKPAKE